MPVRLDPFQNVVGVGWSGGGNGGGPPPTFPFFADWLAVAGGSAETTLPLNAGFEGPSPRLSEEVFPGELLIAQVACDIAPGDPHPQVAITGPAGWEQLYQRSTESAVPGFGFTQTASAWWRIKEEGDQDEWDWTFSPAVARTGILFKISFNRLTGIPEALAHSQDDGSEATIAPSIAPGAANTLLLTLVDADSNFNTNGIYLGTEDQLRRIIWRSFGSQTGHAQVIFLEDWPGPGATGPRQITTTSGHSVVVAHLAIAPPV